MSSTLEPMLPTQQFIPSSIGEYLALQLAKRLADEPAIGRYIRYVEHHPAGHLAKLFHTAKRTPIPAEAFRSSLIPPQP